MKERFEQMTDGDILFWSDAGLYWNYNMKSVEKFNGYVKKISEGNDILVFSQPTIEKEWTKGDVFEALGVYDDVKICDSPQFLGGLFVIRKTAQTMAFVNRWIDLNNLKKELITDKRSTKPNKEGFKENRHDQSIFSVLVKTYPHVVIPWEETQVSDDNWNKMNDFPIQARRLKEIDRPKSEVIKNKLLRPWRVILGFYFKKIRHYDYLCDHYPW